MSGGETAFWGREGVGVETYRRQEWLSSSCGVSFKQTPGGDPWGKRDKGKGRRGYGGGSASAPSPTWGGYLWLPVSPGEFLDPGFPSHLTSGSRCLSVLCRGSLAPGFLRQESIDIQAGPLGVLAYGGKGEDWCAGCLPLSSLHFFFCMSLRGMRVTGTTPCPWEHGHRPYSFLSPHPTWPPCQHLPSAVSPGAVEPQDHGCS